MLCFIFQLVLARASSAIVFLLLLFSPRHLSSASIQLTLKRNSLSDVHCGHSHAEPLHPQSEE